MTANEDENFNTNDLLSKTNRGLEVINMKASYPMLMEYLKSGDASLIQGAILKINEIKNQEDAFVFISKLVGIATKIREAASFRLLDFIKEEKTRAFFQKKEVLSILLKGVDDVNPSVCRNVIESFLYVDDKNFLIENFIKKINFLNCEISQIEDIKNHQNNKKIFNLYWNMQAVCFLSKNFKEEVKPFKKELIELIEKNKNSFNYQIREKSALICFNLLEIFEDKKLLEQKDFFKRDENFYVRKIFTI